jgi:hypothetical protein
MVTSTSPDLVRQSTAVAATRRWSFFGDRQTYTRVRRRRRSRSPTMTPSFFTPAVAGMELRRPRVHESPPRIFADHRPSAGGISAECVDRPIAGFIAARERRPRCDLWSWQSQRHISDGRPYGELAFERLYCSLAQAITVNSTSPRRDYFRIR